MRRKPKDARGRLISTISAALLLGAGLALVFCQLAFFPIFSDVAGMSFHSFLYALPLVGAAVCLSLPASLGLAAALGAVLSLRVQMVPLDYYEYHFSHPLGAMMFSCFVALVLWLAVHGARRITGRDDWAQRSLPRRVAILGVATLFASVVISTVWLQYLNAIYAVYGYAEFVAQMAGELWSVSFWGQVVFDWVFWLAAAVVVDVLVARARAGKESRQLKAVFGRWLLIVVAGAFLLTTTISYSFSTWQALGEADASLTSQVNYLLGQVRSRVESGKSLDGLADSYSFGSSGIVVIFDGDTVAATNDARYADATLTDAFGIEPADVDASDAIVDEGMQFLQDYETFGIRYFKMGRYGQYVVFVSVAGTDVFAHRTATIVLNTLCYLVLFAAVFGLVAQLLNHVVLRGFQRTNDVLALITAGDLEQRVNEHESEEFDALSEGINATVDALKGWIAEAERRMERELETGRAIQRGALPQTFPAFPEIDAFDLYASMDAAKEVGGDFYGFFLVDDRRLGFLIADVSGKGIPGALFMMTAKTQIERYMNAGIPLGDAVRKANEQLCLGNDAGMFVTLWAATLDWETGELVYVNAGHNYPLLRHGRGGAWEWLTQKSGLFLGTFETAKYRQKVATLEPGDELVLYTDGVNEAFSADQEEYGNDRLEGFLAAHNNAGPQELVEALRADVAAWAEGAEQSDDITILCLEYKGPAR